MKDRELVQSTEFDACPLCSDSKAPVNYRLTLSGDSKETCGSLYKDLLVLNKNTNPMQCSNKSTDYRTMCCQATKGKNPLTTIAGLIFLWVFVKRLSKRRIRTRNLAADDDNNDGGIALGISADEISIDYAEMEDGNEARNSPAKRNKKPTKGRGLKKLDDDNDDDDTLFSLQSTIASFTKKAPEAQQKKLRKVKTKKSKTLRPVQIEQPMRTQLV
jgi:hypothetical protein